MQLPKLPEHMLDSIKVTGAEETSRNDPVKVVELTQSLTRSPTKRTVAGTLSPPKRKAKGIKFVNQSSNLRQKQLMRVQNERTEARIQQHMQRFERLINKAGSTNARSHAAGSNDEMGINITEIMH